MCRTFLCSGGQEEGTEEEEEEEVGEEGVGGYVADEGNESAKIPQGVVTGDF